VNNPTAFTGHEADAASLRLAFNRAVEKYPQHLCQFLSKDAEAAFRLWWGQFYEAVRDHTAGLAILAELQRLRERDEHGAKGEAA
jgi:hypothetical protein